MVKVGWAAEIVLIGIDIITTREIQRSQLNLLFIEPLYLLPILPNPILLLALALQDAQAMLLSILPPAFEFPPIREDIYPETILLIILVLSFVRRLICVDKDTHTVLLILEPLASV